MRHGGPCRLPQKQTDKAGVVFGVSFPQAARLHRQAEEPLEAQVLQVVAAST